MTQATVRATTNEGVQRQVTAANAPGVTNVRPPQRKSGVQTTGTAKVDTPPQRTASCAPH